MPRNANLSGKAQFYKPDYISRKELEQYFNAVQERFNGVDKRFDEQDKKFENMQSTLQIILSITQNYDVERKDIKSSLWEHDRRLTKVEKQLA